MAKNWSINPDTRNPDRIREFLRVLAEFEGHVFDEKTQIAFFRRIVQRKLYVPNGVRNNPIFQPYYAVAEELPEEIVNQVMRHVKEQGLRGRGKAAPLSHFGFCIARESLGKVVITESGRQFLDEDANLSEVFLRVFLKWQFPNPLSRDFSAAQGFNLIPFVATLHFIAKVNAECKVRGVKAKGISQEECALFLLTLKHIDHLDEQVKALFSFRDQLEALPFNEKEDCVRNYAYEIMSTVFDVDKQDREELDKKWKIMLNDYTDTVMRYFRLTDYLYLRGNGYYYDLSPAKTTEISSLLKTFRGAALSFGRNIDQYVSYLADISAPELPWENCEDLFTIWQDKAREIAQLADIMHSRYGEKQEIALPPEPHELDQNGLKQSVEQLEQIRSGLIALLQKRESQQIEALERYISVLRQVEAGTINNRAMHLEWYTSLSLESLNDALAVQPNYPKSSDNSPLFTAAAGKPDIECFYEQFNMTCEVTTLRDRSQWMAEGQPVMRHLRAFEDKHPAKEAYCLFIAPAIHQDTLNTFFIANKWEYQGKPQRIVPLTIAQYTILLEYVVAVRKAGRNIKHEQLLGLLQDILADVPVRTSLDWLSSIPAKIATWGVGLTDSTLNNNN